ncbi:hypothetical protein HDU98_002365 [Podochytrium sp. JEL0797]|nr:hypothetical protein HDU98_002365 [Podochytrium sp. JEL0797]
MAEIAEAPKKRIISMLPAACEMICLCGGESMLVGRSHEDDYPRSVISLPILTGSNTVFDSSAGVEDQVQKALTQGNGMYFIHPEVLLELKPTHIVTQDLCHVCAIDLQTVERIANRLPQVPQIITLNPLTFSDVLDDILRVGKALDLESGAEAAMKTLTTRIDKARSTADALLAENSGTRKRVLFVEWTDPVYPGGHWTPQLIYMAGGNQPAFPGTDVQGAGPSIRIAHEACVASDPEVIVVAPCGLNLVEAKREVGLILEMEWFQTMLKPGVRVCVVDGSQMFNRPGPRLVDALEFLVGFVWDKEELIPAGFPWEKVVLPSEMK